MLVLMLQSVTIIFPQVMWVSTEVLFSKCAAELGATRSTVCMATGCNWCRSGSRVCCTRCSVGADAGVVCNCSPVSRYLQLVRRWRRRFRACRSIAPQRGQVPGWSEALRVFGTDVEAGVDGVVTCDAAMCGRWPVLTISWSGLVIVAEVWTLEKVKSWSVHTSTEKKKTVNKHQQIILINMPIVIFFISQVEKYLFERQILFNSH